MKSPVVFLSRLPCHLFFSFLLVFPSAHLSAQEVPEQPIIKEIDIRFVGAATVDEGRIRANLSSRVGERYSNAVSDQDIKNLYASGDVDFVDVLPEDVPGGIRLIYKVKTRGRLGEISFVGAGALGEDRLLREVNLKVGDSLAEVKLRAARQNIDELYRKRGFGDVSVKYEVTEMEGREGYSKVEFEISEGGRIIIKDIVFDGNTAFSDRRLRSEMKLKEHGLLSFLTNSGKLDRVKLGEDLAHLEFLYQDKGYIYATVGEWELVPVDEKRVNLVITVSEGEVYGVADVSIVGNNMMSVDQLQPLLTVKGGGQTYSAGATAKDEARLRDFYGSKGYADSKVRTSITDAGGNMLNVIYEIEEGEVSYLGRVNILGNVVTQDRVLRRELAVTPGDIYNRTALNASQKRLKNLHYFASVDYNSYVNEATGFRDLDIHVRELPQPELPGQSTGNVKLAAGFSSIDNLVGILEVTQTNFDLFGWPHFKGAGQRFRFSLRAGPDRTDTVISLTEPWLFGKPLSGTVEAFYRDQRFMSDFYDLTKYGARFSLTKKIGESPLRARVGYTIQELDLDVTNDASDIIKLDEGKYTQSKMELGLIYDTRSSFFLPRNGAKFEVEGTMSGSFLGGDVDFYGLSASGVKHFGLPFDTIFTLKGRVAVVDVWNGADHVPIFDREFLGGLNDLRGFSYRSDVGPKDENGEAIGGNTSAFFTAEFTFPVLKGIYGAVFWDVGLISEPSYDLGGDVYSDVGLGIRWEKSPFGPLRANVGFPIQSDGSGSSVEFSFGAGYEF